MAKSPADPGCRGFLQVVMDRTLADQASSGDLPLRQLESKAEAQDFLDLSHGHCSSLALDLSRKVYIGEIVCPGVMSSATSPYGKHPNFIVITIPGITKN